ncbi:kinesin family protein [Moniliophthora roreri MCA 2997]|uniref:Kinesin-like protein n=2 Tax=Moniliophthora roreri TaxID=221103 RepID=V2Z0L8_MONRO|nr:kinesin family protein [Moniliophthora roreri MCA 2997]KAI3596708.1 kinesin family protein [Moniliophthora roreri]
MVAAGSITVAVRVRPPTSWEAARLPEPCYDTTFRGDGALSTPGRSVANTAPLREVVQIVDDRILTFDPDEKDKARAFVERGFTPPGTKRYKDRRFMFDKVFDGEACQQDVYEATAMPLLQGVLDGYNATVFAYGATGCGKTHTISGTEADPGIIYLAMADLFQRIEDRKDEWLTEVVVTFLEIYNEEIRDLLAEPGTNAPRGGLSIREDKTVKVAGLVELSPKSAEQVKEIVLLGNTRRTQSPTHANETSSRSHAVLQIHVTQSPRTASLTEQKTMATLSIIDLAGSERAAATTNMGQRMVEGANINKSLLALGNCINALCESGGAIRHVPYRNSKLTRLLKFSLGGNCKTVMIVCVAPTSHHFDDTHNTLIYAERATKIKTKVVTRNVVNVDRHVGRYVEAINRLNAEVAELKAKLAGKKDNEEQLVRRKKAEANAEVERAKHDMQVKVDQTKASIIDGAACSGKLSVARAKLDPIRQRLTKLESMGTLSADLEAERALLKAVAGPEEQALKSDSVLSVRLQRSSNANAMFDATMRAVSERKSEKLDEVSVENVKLDARCRRAEMEQAKAEEERDVMNSAVSDIAQTMVGLIGMLGRCTVMIGEASSNLRSPHDDPAATAQSIAAMLDNLKAKNDEAFTQLVGHSTEGYRLDERASLGVFKGYDMSFTRRVSSGPPALQNTSSSSSRRLSSHTSLSASPRRHKSPRKSLRSSLAAQPYRRVSDKEKKGLKMSKNVQWRDEAGQGDLVDEGLSLNPITVNVIPASPFTDSISAPSVTETPPTRASSVAGSESEWESEGEKTDDSVSFNLSMSLPASFSDTLSRSGVPGKRPRPSRLDPSFLKSKARTPALGSLAEDDESSPERRERRVSQPLGDRNINQMDGDVLGSKVKQAGPSSPGKRAPSTPRGASKSRRRSNIGPVRAEKGRRRSSMIPQLSPPNGEGSKPRRVLLGTPAKRSKRLSLSRPAPIPMRRPPSSASSNLSIADTSISVSRPTWR